MTQFPHKYIHLGIAQFGPAMVAPQWKILKNTLMVGQHMCILNHLYIYTDDPESRVLYEHHAENEMTTTFMHVRYYL